MPSVVGAVNRPRTQNVHIRNDTRDASRRISSPINSPICRRNCVATDRACTRVTHRNLHGKEGVDGSSPSGALQKRRKLALFTFFVRLHLHDYERASGMERFMELSVR